MELLNNHVTIRKFQAKEISRKTLESIIYSGTRASTTGNMQLYSVIVSAGKTKDQLVPLHFNQPVAKSAPVILTIVADVNRFSKWAESGNASPGFANFLSFFNASVDALLAAQNICIAAENLGLGICYLGTAVYNAPEIIGVLKLPKLTFPVAAIALGYPDETPPLNDRLPLKGIMHFEEYQEYNDSDIKALYRFKENLESSKKFVAENGKETLAQVFTDVRYKKADNEFFSSKMLRTLKDQGFDI